MEAGTAPLLSFPAAKPALRRRLVRRAFYLPARIPARCFFYGGSIYLHNFSSRTDSSSFPLICVSNGSGCQPEESNEDNSGSLTSSDILIHAKPLLEFMNTNFLPIALISGMAVGFVSPELGSLAHQHSLSKYSIFSIFLVSGLLLRDAEIRSTNKAWPAGLFGLVSILFLTPSVARLLLRIKIVPQEFSTGLALFCCMPTTLSSGVTLTQLAGGNSALALAMTLLSNVIGIVIVPFSLSVLFAEGTGISIPLELFKGLVVSLLIPLFAGKIIRNTFANVANYVDRNRRLFSVINAILLSLVPWMQVSRSRSLLLTVEPLTFLTIFGLGMLLHVLFLLGNMLALKALSKVVTGNTAVFTKKENARAVILVASQKTLPVLVAVVEQLKGQLGESGLLVLPCVAAHLTQIIIDSFLVNYWLRDDVVSEARVT